MVREIKRSKNYSVSKTIWEKGEELHEIFVVTVCTQHGAHLIEHGERNEKFKHVLDKLCPKRTGARVMLFEKATCKSFKGQVPIYVP